MSKRMLLSPIFVWYLMVMALVILVYALLVRPFHMRWGASAAEMAMPLPGDQYLTPTTVFSTRAITIHAPAENVWRWMIRLGQERGGFYSYEWLENIFAANMKNADSLLQGIEIRRPGDIISYMENGPSDEISFLEEGKTMIIGRGWTFQLLPEDEKTTRLIIRYPYELGEDLFNTVFYYSIFEEVHFVMEAGMMLGIKQRSEQPVQPAGYAPVSQPEAYLGWSYL